MDEIRVRVWDISNKEMLPSSSIWKCNFTLYTHGDYIIMQYSGCKDKNNKEIFAGDILQDDYGNIFEVLWSKSAFIVYKNKSEVSILLMAIDTKNVTIISNIHIDYYYIRNPKKQIIES